MTVQGRAALAATSARVLRDLNDEQPGLVAFARSGGFARAASMTAEERSESARKAARARWKRRHTT